MFDRLRRKLNEAIAVLEAQEGELDEKEVQFITKTGQGSVKTNAYRQIQRFHNYLLGSKHHSIAYKSKTYQRKKQKLGMKSEFWTLVFSGALYKSLRYNVINGVLYAEYDDTRNDVIPHLKALSGLSELIYPSLDEAKDMALEYHRSVVQKFLEVWHKKE